MRKLLLTALLCQLPLFAEEVFIEGVEVKGKRERVSSYEIGEVLPKDPSEVLERSSGIWKLRKGGIAGDVIIRGFDRGDINVLYDNSRIYSACPNRMDPPLFHIDPLEVESIEIIKGPFDVKNYGVIGGSLNLITKKPRKGLRAKISLTGGSFSYVNSSAEASYRKDNLYGAFGYSYRYSKPYETGEGKLFTEYTNYKEEFKKSTSFNINTLWLKAGYSFSENKDMEISYTAQRIRDVLYPYLMMDSPEDNADRMSLKFNFGNIKLNTYYSYIYHLMNNRKRKVNMFMETESNSLTYGAKLSYESKGKAIGVEAFRWKWSAETRMGSMKQASIPDVTFQDLGVFGEIKRNLGGRLKAVAGIRLDSAVTEADSDKANRELYYTYHNTRSLKVEEFYPSGNVQVYYSPRRDLRLFTLIGYAVRSPDPQERFFALNRSGMMENMYGDWVGNPDLRPVKNTEIDIGFDLRKGMYSLKTTLFYSYVRDFITLYNQENVNTTGLGTKARSYTNVDAKIYGGEIESFLALGKHTFLEASLSYTKGVKSTDPAKGIKDPDIAEIPPLKGRIALRYDRIRYFGEIESLFQATQKNVDSDLGETETPGWAVVNLKAGVKYKNVKAVAGVKNLFNKFYYEHLSYLRDPFSTGIKLPEPGRELFVSLEAVF